MRKTLFFATLVVAMLAASCSKYKYDSVAGDPMQTRIYTLQNGLTVYMSVNQEQPRLQTMIAVKAGGKNDPAATTGLAHYFEHLMFKGTSHFGTQNYEAEKPMLDSIQNLFEYYRTVTDSMQRLAIYHRIDSISYEASKLAIPNEYDKLMSAIGASGSNAYTSQDVTCFVEDIPSNEIDNWAKIQADRFQDPVIRGFHTELEAVYEEKNLSLTQDARKVWEAMDAALYPHHPYGTQTVLGTQENLKNPSIVNIKNFYKTYYVPNNMAICVSGDFNPDSLIVTIDKYFGAMKRSNSIPQLQFRPETPITTPVVKEVTGLDAANVMLGWRLPKATDKANDIAQIAGYILNNGQAGLIDLDLNQQQKTLQAFGGVNIQPDYGEFLVGGTPKEGQTLDEVRDLLLQEVAKLRSGDFNDSLLMATINNLKLEQMQLLESNEDRAQMFVDAFIDGENWADAVNQIDRMSKITKQQVVDWANQYLGAESYAVVYKREGVDTTIRKVVAPKITPIETNRDKQSDYVTAVQNAKVQPIEPVFVDYTKDMSQFKAQSDINVLYKQNTLNGTFTLSYIYNIGTEQDPALNLAFSYLDYLGTDKMTAEQFKAQMYDLACYFSTSAGSNQSIITISGLSENMEKAMDLVEQLLAAPKADETILASLKADRLKARADAKLDMQSNQSTLQRYLFYGKDFITRTTLTNPQLMALTSDELLGKIKALTGDMHEILYYGPQKQEAVKTALAEHHKVPATLQPLEKKFAAYQLTPKNQVILAQYKANRIAYYMFSDRGEKFDLAAEPAITLYNEYFGGGMNTVVFQEIREARGLAYSAMADIFRPYYADGTYGFIGYIATQNDKMKEALTTMSDIVENMPASEKSFDLAKAGLLARLRTERTVRENVLWSYISDRDRGLTEPEDKLIFDKVQTMTLDDIKATQQQWIKGRTYTYGILGDQNDLDLNYLKTLGPVENISQTELFGY